MRYWRSHIAVAAIMLILFMGLKVATVHKLGLAKNRTHFNLVTPSSGAEQMESITVSLKHYSKMRIFEVVRAVAQRHSLYLIIVPGKDGKEREPLFRNNRVVCTFQFFDLDARHDQRLPHSDKLRVSIECLDNSPANRTLFRQYTQDLAKTLQAHFKRAVKVET